MNYPYLCTPNSAGSKQQNDPEHLEFIHPYNLTVIVFCF